VVVLLIEFTIQCFLAVVNLCSNQALRYFPFLKLEDFSHYSAKMIKISTIFFYTPTRRLKSVNDKVYWCVKYTMMNGVRGLYYFWVKSILYAKNQKK
jgi:hypothetical protein